MFLHSLQVAQMNFHLSQLFPWEGENVNHLYLRVSSRNGLFSYNLDGMTAQGFLGIIVSSIIVLFIFFNQLRHPGK